MKKLLTPNVRLPLRLKRYQMINADKRSEVNEQIHKHRGPLDGWLERHLGFGGVIVFTFQRDVFDEFSIFGSPK